MPDSRRERWAQDFEAAALDLLAQRTDLPTQDYYRCRTEPCPHHGPACLTVICGELLEHVRWEDTAPAVFAEELLRRMLPPKTPD